MALPALRIADENARSMPTRVNLTDAGVLKLTCPPGKVRHRVYDAKVPGLCVSVLATGGRAFYWYGRVKANPRPVEHSLGKVGKINLADARQRAKEINANAAKGDDPAKALRAKKEKARQAISVRQLWEAYRDQHLKVRGRASTLVSDQNRYDLHLSAWAGRIIGDIAPDDVAAFHATLTTTKTGNTADKTVKLLRRMLTYGKVNPNPASRAVTFHGDAKCERFLTVDELARLTIALAAAENTTIADALRFCLLTGARRGNVSRARWADLHLAQAVWTIPSAESKNGRPMSIPLAPAAVDLLKTRQHLAAKSPYIFPGRRPDRPLVEWKTTWDRIRKAAKIEGVRIHDLRHTLASHMAMSGASLLAIGKQLGHQNQQSTARYSHLELSAVRPSTEAAVAAMFPPTLPAAASDDAREGQTPAESGRRGKRA